MDFRHYHRLVRLRLDLRIPGDPGKIQYMDINMFLKKELSILISRSCLKLYPWEAARIQESSGRLHLSLVPSYLGTLRPEARYFATFGLASTAACNFFKFSGMSP
jgi:hypothetical protein